MWSWKKVSRIMRSLGHRRHLLGLVRANSRGKMERGMRMGMRMRRKLWRRRKWRLLRKIRKKIGILRQMILKKNINRQNMRKNKINISHSLHLKISSQSLGRSQQDIFKSPSQ